MNAIFLLSLVFVGISMLISTIMKNKFKKYSAHALNGGLTGKEVAEKMLKDNHLYDVQVISVQGYLTDHYTPTNKTVNLSPEVYHGNSTAAAAVAAHECGHAVQHATAYNWLMMRSTLVPIVQFSSTIVQWVLLAGIVLVNAFPSLLLIGIGLFTLITIFAVITLPVEFDASRRALVWLETNQITYGQEHKDAKDALKWAAMTYVVAAVASIATLVQYILIYLGNRDRD